MQQSGEVYVLEKRGGKKLNPHNLHLHNSFTLTIITSRVTFNISVVNLRDLRKFLIAYIKRNL